MTTAVAPSRSSSPRPAEPDEPRRLRIDAPLVIAAGTAVVASVLYWAIHYSLGDDAYITLAYAKNLAYHGTWGILPHQGANSATSPLNVLLIAAGTAVTRRPLLALGIVFVASSAVLAWTTARVAQRMRVPLLGAVLAVALVLANAFVLSSTGLESILLAAIVGALLCCAVEGRPIAFGIIAGLALVARLDTVLFIVPLLVSSPRVRRRWLAVTGMAFAASVPWFLPRWFAGSAIPDTFVVKTLQKRFGTETFANGPWAYMTQYHSKARASFAPVLVAGLVLVGWVLFLLIRDRWIPRSFRPVIALAIGAAIYYGAYSALQVPPYHWYYSPVIVPACMILGLTSAAIVRRVAGARGVRRRWAQLVFIPAVLLLGAEVLVVIHHGLPWRSEPIIFGNWADPSYYRAMGKELHGRVGDKLVKSPGEVGTIAFYCECNIVDEFSDQRFAIPLINQRIDKASPVMRALLNANYARLDLTATPPPVDYHLVFEPGWVNEPDTWWTWSTTRGFGHLRLVPGSG
jgi:hypothetical protein